MSAVSSTTDPKVTDLNGQPAVVVNVPAAAAGDALPESFDSGEHLYTVLSDENVTKYAPLIQAPTTPLTPVTLPPEVSHSLTGHQKCLKMKTRLQKIFPEQISSKANDDIDIGRKKRTHFLADVDLSSQTRHFARLQVRRQKYDELVWFVNHPAAALSDHNAQAITDLEHYFAEEFPESQQKKNSSPRKRSPSPTHDITTGAEAQIRELIHGASTANAPQLYESFIRKMRVVQIAAVVALVAGIVLGFTVNRKFFALAYGAFEIGAAAWHAEKGATAGNPYIHSAEIFKLSPGLRLLNWVFFSQIKKPFIPPVQSPEESTPESVTTATLLDSATETAAPSETK